MLLSTQSDRGNICDYIRINLSEVHTQASAHAGKAITMSDSSTSSGMTPTSNVNTVPESEEPKIQISAGDSKIIDTMAQFHKNQISEKFKREFLGPIFGLDQYCEKMNYERVPVYDPDNARTTVEEITEAIEILRDIEPGSEEAQRAQLYVRGLSEPVFERGFSILYRIVRDSKLITEDYQTCRDTYYQIAHFDFVDTLAYHISRLDAGEDDVRGWFIWNLNLRLGGDSVIKGLEELSPGNPRKMTPDDRKFLKTSGQFEMEHGRKPTPEELAEILGWTTDRVNKNINRSFLRSMIYLDKPLESEDNEGKTVGDTVKDPQNGNNPGEFIVENESMNKLWETLRPKLSDFEFRVLELIAGRWTGVMMTQKAVAKELGTYEKKVWRALLKIKPIAAPILREYQMTVR